MGVIRRAELACSLGAGGAGLAALAYILFAPVLRDGSMYTAADGSLITTVHYVSGIQRGLTPFDLFFFLFGLASGGIALSAVLHVRTRQRAWRNLLAALTSVLLVGIIVLNVLYLPDIWRFWHEYRFVVVSDNAYFLPCLALAVVSALMAFRIPTHPRNQAPAREVGG
jgi:hypothetical protein